MYEFLAHNEFLNSNFFIAATTLVVGFAAYFVYKKQKRDEKKDAATVLLAEVKGATSILPGLVSRFRSTKAIDVDGGQVLLPSESWSKYKYLFVNDLKPEEWQAIGDFYKNCLAYDAAVAEKQSYFEQNTKQIWVSIHRNYYESLREHFADGPIEVQRDSRGLLTTEIPQAVAEKINTYTDTYISNSGQLAGYEPIKPTNDAERALNDINQNLLLSSAGQRLEEFANPRLFFIFRLK